MATISVRTDNTTLINNGAGEVSFSPSAAVSMNAQRLTGLGDPINPDDAATVAYVLSAGTAGASLTANQTFSGTNTFSQPIIGSLTGNAATATASVQSTFAGSAVEAQHATNADFAQNSGVATVAHDFFAPVSLQLTGSVTGTASISGSTTPVTLATTFTGNLNSIAAPTADYSFASHKITNLTNPTNAQDAATKNYVDNSTGGGWNLGPVFYADLFSQTLTAGVEAKLQCSFIRFNKGFAYDPNTTYTFTAPIAGYYHFIGQILVTNSPGLTSLQLTVYKGGTAGILKNFINLGTNITSNQGVEVVGIDEAFNVGDTYELRALATGTNATVTFASFMGYMIAPI